LEFRSNTANRPVRDALVLLAPPLAGEPAAAQTLKAVRDRGALACGVSRGLLLDVAGEQMLPPEYSITPADLEHAASRAQVEIRAGDVVLVRTGCGALWSDPAAYLRGPGVSAAGSSWLIAKEVRAVGADNLAWDVMGPVDPELKVTLPGHVLLLVRAGIPIIENLYLEELAAAGAHEFTFICLPLKMRGATGSPVRPIAIA